MKNILFISVFILSLLTGCKDTITGEEIDKREIPQTNVSFSKHLYPVLNIKCATAGCHEDFARAGGLSVTTWGNITADPGVVFPFEPDNSRLVWAIEARAGVPPMPPVGYPPLTFEQIRGIRTWIAEGAQNN
jgi:hypothetical protein